MLAFNIIVMALASTVISASDLPQVRRGQSAASKPPASNASSAIPPGNFTFDQLWSMNNKFWTAFLSPNNQKQAKSINSTLFSEDVKGKIDATRTFDGRELNTEYAFGLFANIALNPGTFSLLGVPLSYEITQFAANTNIVACTLLIDFRVIPLNTTYPIEIVGWFTYNAKGQISQYDATFLRGLEWQFATMTQQGMRMFNLPTLAVTQNFVQKQLAGSICSTAQKYCNGTNQQYANQNECNTFLTNGSVPLGEAWQLGMDTVGCRMVHMNMVPARPDVHCSHIGPTGGMYCNNARQYASYTTQKYFTNQPFIPGNRVSKGHGSLS